MIFCSDHCSQLDRIYENVNPLALGRNSVSLFPRSPYKSGRLSDVNQMGTKEYSVSLNPLQIRETFRPEKEKRVEMFKVLIPYKSGRLSDCTTIFIIN